MLRHTWLSWLTPISPIRSEIYDRTHLGLGHGLALEQGLALVPCRNGLIPQGKQTNSGATIAGQNASFPKSWSFFSTKSVAHWPSYSWAKESDLSTGLDQQSE